VVHAMPITAAEVGAGLLKKGRVPKITRPIKTMSILSIDYFMNEMVDFLSVWDPTVFFNTKQI
jgi:hypothetical protein